MRTRGVPKADSSNPSSDQVFAIYVNGAEKLVYNYANKAWRDHVIDFGAGELRTGWNTISMRTDPYDNCYWMIDYYRFKTVLDRGFSIPPPGFMLIVK